MSTQPETPTPADFPPGASHPGASLIADASAGAPTRPGRLWALALGAGLAAGLASSLFGEATHLYFVPTPNLVETTRGPMNLPVFEARASAGMRNAALASAGFGAILGLLLGLAGGLARHSFRAGLLAGLAGVLLGGAAGAGSAAAVVPRYYHELERSPEDMSHDLVLPLLIHGGMWAAIGAAAGAALGIGLGSGRLALKAAVGGLIGGLLGALAYEVIGALAFANGGAADPVAVTQTPRLIARFTVSMLVAVVAAFAVLDTRRGTARKRAAPEAAA
jgi:hypothetical protein